MAGDERNERTMRRLWTPILAALLAAMAASSVAVAAGGDPFTRTWSRVDFDGSRETLGFEGSGGAKTFAYRDDRATVCGGGAFEAGGTVVVDGDVATLDGVGGCVGDPSGPYGATLTYDPATQTLDDGFGLLWTRGSGAREAFSGSWRATDLDGSAMKLSFKGSGLERNVTYTDSIATSCDPDAVWMASGTGTIGSTPGQGRYITLALHGGCLGQGSVDYVEVYRYDVETDTLRGPLDGDGNELFFSVDWHRG
jgi:hypothetical protein